MSERITGELRGKMNHTTASGCPLVELGEYEFASLCDAIDAVHANLERENESLRKQLAKPSGGARSIGSATVTVTPTLDWTGVARELRSIADALGSCNCTNSERTSDSDATAERRGDAVEVVQCRDCACFSVDDSDHDYRTGWWCKRWYTDMVKPDGFCAWGRRADG